MIQECFQIVFGLCNTRLIEAENLYRDLVGDEWDQLGPGVRRGMTPPYEAVGDLEIVHARRGIAGLMVRLVKLPPPGDSVETRLSLKVEERGVRWVREYGSFRAESLQTFREGCFLETAGPFVLVMRTKRRDRDLAHVQVGTKLFGLSVPRFMGPWVSGLMSDVGDDQSWGLDVEIGHVWFGTLLRYRGTMKVV